MLDKYIQYFKIAEICTIVFLVLYFITAAINTGRPLLDILSTILVVLMIASSIATYAFFILIKRHGNR